MALLTNDNPQYNKPKTSICKNHINDCCFTRLRQPLKVKKTSQLIRHQTLCSFVQELQLPLDSERLGRSSSTHPVSSKKSEQVRNQKRLREDVLAKKKHPLQTIKWQQQKKRFYRYLHISERM